MKHSRIFVLKQIKPYIKNSSAQITAMVLASALIIPLTLANPKIFQLLIDNVMGKEDFSQFPFVAAAFLVVFLIKTMLELVNLKLSNNMIKKFTLSVRADLWKRYSLCNNAMLNKLKTGDLKMRMMDDVDSLGNFLQSQVMEYSFAILTVLVTLYAAITTDILMTLCCLLIIPVVFLINYCLGKRSQKVNEEIRKVNEQYFTSTHESLQAWKEIKLQGAEKQVISKFQEFRNVLAKLGLKNMRYWSFWEIFNDFKANYLTRVFVYIVGAFFVIAGEISVGTLIMFAEYFALLFSSLDTINYKRSELRINFPYYNRIFDALSFQADIHGTNLLNRIDTILFDRVGFSYENGEKKVLKEITFELKKGDRITVVGENGCGKSTLLKLLLSLYEPQNGRILINGNDRNLYADSSFYRLTGVVMQDSFFFDGTIRENLCLAKPDASKQELESVCQAVNLYDFIQEQPQKFDTVIGERGNKLSGGQKQRLAIARALLKKPQLLILDEATSRVDRISEEIIGHALHSFCEECTLLYVTHKPSGAKKAANVIFMDDGKIAGIGTHRQLMEHNTRYQFLMGE